MMTDTYLPQVNGVATSVNLFKQYLEDLDERIYVFAPVIPPDEKDVFKVTGLKFFWEPQHRFAVPLSKKILNLSKKLDIDLVHSHAPFSMGFQAMRLSEKLGLPHVHTYHTMLTEYRHYLPMPFRPTENAVKEFSAWFCNLTDAVIAPTRKINDALLGYGVRVPIYTLPTGIDVKNFQRPLNYSIRKRHSIPEEDRIILFVGRVAKEKNINFVVDAFALLHRDYPDTTLIIIGDGPEKSEILHRVTRSGLSGKVIMAGYVPRKDIVEYYRESDLFAFASVTETQGLVVLEALAAGLPVVAVAREGVADVLENEVGCLLVEDVEMNPFVEKISKFLDDDGLRRKMSVDGVKYVSDNWSMETMARQLDYIYKDVMSSSKRRRKKDGFESLFTYLYRFRLRVL